MLGFAGLEEFDFILEMKLKSDFDSTLFLVDWLQTEWKNASLYLQIQEHYSIVNNWFAA